MYECGEVEHHVPDTVPECNVQRGVKCATTTEFTTHSSLLQSRNFRLRSSYVNALDVK